MAKHRNTAIVTFHRRKALLVGCAGIAMSFYNGSALANPDGPDVVGGNIGISGLGTSQVDIVQSTSRGAINWDSFSIGNGETTRFTQPDSNSITLNRVTGADPSQILGTMTANGKIILINGNGILFGPDSKVDAAGLVATTHDVDTDAFMAGAPLRFFTGTHELPNASVVNEGQITIHDAGVAAFVAPSVRNSGLIQADMGRVALGAGKGFTLDLYGDDLISFQVNDNISSTLTAADGTPLRALVENDGLIQAAGGRIMLTAATAREVVNQAVHVSGTVSASSVTKRGGDIILGGPGAGIVNVENAHISAKGKTGGSVKVLGDQVTVKASTLDASGDEGGGTIRIGGGDHGGEGLQSARTVSFDKDSKAIADALVNGDGGSIVLWSDNGTDFSGAISARGEGEGQGGYAEVSSLGLLAYHGTADLRAANGKTGTLLLDPENITISNGATTLLTCSAGSCTATGDSSVLNVTDLINALSTSNVTVSTGAVGSQAGTITVANNISWSNANLLTLSAASSITINSGVSITNTYNGAYTAGRIPVVLALRADNAGANNSSTITNNGTINMSGSSGAVALYYDNGVTYTAGTQTANGSWAAPTDGSVSSQFTAYRLVNTVADLAAINTNATTLGYTYALGKNIVGSGAFNSNAPMGVFTGILDGGFGKLAGGSNYTITGLTLGPANNTLNVGLFGTNSGTLRNFGLGFAVTATGSSTAASYNGTLAGINNGMIANVASTGAIGYTYTGSGSTGNTTNIGGLVGQNNTAGVIINSTASGAVTLNQNGTFTSTAAVNVGGLAGRNDSTVTTSISGSGASGNVTAQYGTGTAKTTLNIGGLVGLGTTATIISNSTYSTGTVTSSLQNGVVNIGGLLGYGSIVGANITGATTSGNVSFTGAGSSTGNIGGITGTTLGSITSSNSSAIESYSGTGSGAITMGGIAGTSSGGVNSSGATGSVTYGGTGSGAGTIGGLIGTNTGAISSSTATGAVTFNGSGNGAMIIGGLIGSNASTIVGSNSTTGAVGYTGSGTGGGTIGGLVGSNLAAGTITNSYSTSAASFATTGASGSSLVGGLVGNNAGAIEGTGSLYSYATGTSTLGASVTGASSIGGLVGINSGSIKQAYSTGVTMTITAPGALNVGGLVGNNTGTVGDSAALTATTYTNNVVIVNGTPSGTSAPTDNVGGLIGTTTGASAVYNAAASGDVSYNYQGTSTGNMKAYVGGLVGTINSTAATSITNGSYAGNVKAQYTTGYSASGGVTQAVGGLVGYMVTNGSEILNSVSSGTVSDSLDGKSAAEYVGGLVGYVNIAAGTITNSHSSSAVSYTGTGSPSVGGLVGYNRGTIQSGSYATGSITIGDSTTSSIYIGGLAGQQAAGASILNSYSDNGTITYTDALSVYMGGLVGSNAGTIGDVNATSATTYSNTNIIMNAIPTGTTANTYSLGNLAGANSGTIVNTKTGGDVTFNYAGSSTGTTTLNLGGLVGSNSSTSATSITASTSSNTVTAQIDAAATGTKPITASIGGLEGQASGAAGVVSGVSSSSTVIANLGAGSHSIGGLVGNISGTTSGVTNSFATGDVSYTGVGTAYVGGLAGYNKGIIQGTGSSYSYATGNVSVDTGTASGSTASVGGLVGTSIKTVLQSYSQNGLVKYTGGQTTVYVGGLIGLSTTGVVGDATATSLSTYSTENIEINAAPIGSVAQVIYAGGLIGQLGNNGAGSLTNANASGSILYKYQGTSTGASVLGLGGLVGNLYSTTAASIQKSAAQGSIVAQYNGGYTGNVNGYAGGLIGYIVAGSTVQTSWASGAVTSGMNAATGSQYLGGLVGLNNVASGTLTNNYAVGAVNYTGTSTYSTGGLVGNNKGAVNQSYSTGYVMNTGATAGGLIGSNTGTVTDGYWDTGTSGRSASAAGTGVTTATLQNALQGSFSATTWGIVADETNPYLKWQIASGTPQSVSGYAYNDQGTTALSNASVAASSNGTAVSSILTKDGNAVTGANGYYYFFVAPGTLPTTNTNVMTYLTGATKANSVIDTANKASGSVTGLDLYANYLHEYSASTSLGSMLSTLGSALGSNTGSNFLYTYSAGTPTMKAGTTLMLDASGTSLALNQVLNASGASVYIKNTGIVTQTQAITANALALSGLGGSYTLTNSGNNIGKIAANTGSVSLKNAATIAIDSVSGINGITTTGATQVVAGGAVILNNTITAGGTGNNILLTGTGFTNNAGSSALTTGSGYFRVWSGAPSSDTRGGLAYDYKQYNATYGVASVLGTGNGFLYTAAPVLTDTLANITKIYNGNTGVNFTGATQTVGGAIDGDTVTLSLAGATGTYNNKNAGTGKSIGSISGITIASTTNGSATVYGYQLSQPSSASGDITQASLSITGATAGDKVYDGTTAATLGGSAALSGKISGDTVTLVTAGATGTFNNKNAGGNKVVTASGYAISGADAANYTLSQPTGLTASISQAALTLSGLSAGNKVYDSTTTATLSGTAALSGLMSGDTVTLGGTGSGTFANKNVGTAKAVTVAGYSISGTDAANYTFSQPTGLSANITAASLSITGISASNRVYDATTTATLGGTAALSGKYAGDTVTLGGTGSGSFADKNVGTAKAVTVNGYTISGTDASNYVLSQPTGLSANVTAASLSVSGLSASGKVYDSTTAAVLSGTAALSGKYAGDTVTLGGSGTAAFGDKNVGTAKTVTVTGYTISGADASNYTLNQPTGLSASITAAALNIAGLSASNKIYDSTTTATLTGTAALSGKYAGDTVTLGGTGAGAFADKNVANGKSVIVTGYTISGTDASNYTLSQPTGLSANITAAALNIAGLSASNKIYDSTTTATLTGTAALSGKYAGDTVTLGGTGSGTFADKNAGTAKAVTVSGYTISGTDASNYTLSQPTGLSANITAATLNITGLTASNKVYDSTATASLTGTAALTGKYAGDTVTLGGTGTGAFADKNVANNKAVTVTGYTISGGDSTNYILSLPTGLLANITPASLGITGVSALDKVYDSTTLASLSGTAALSGKFSGDVVNLGGTGSGTFADKNVANGKTVTVTGYTIIGTDASNYTLSQPTGLSANITPASLSITGLTAQNKVYDTTTTASLSGTAALSGKYAGDTVTLGGTASASFADKNVANNKAVSVAGYTISGTDATNYTLSQPTGLTANITTASLSVTGLSASNKVYDATALATLTGTAALSGKLGSDAVTLGGTGAGSFADKNVANGKAVTVAGYSISGTDAGNYTFTQPTGLTANITPASLSIGGVTAQDKVYDALLTASLGGTATLNGKLGSDNVTLGGTASGVFANKNVANGKAVTVTGYSISGTDAGNYTLSQPTGLTANITPASISVTNISANNKVYDGLTTGSVSGTAALLGKKAGDIVTVSGAGATYNFDDKNVGAGKDLNVTGYTIAGADAGNYILSQPTGLIADITPAALTLSGISALGKTYDSTTAATLSGTAALGGKISGDTVVLSTAGATGTFADKSVGTNKSVTVSGYSISGTDAGNYTLTQPTGLSATITQAALTLSGLGVSDKVYDATTTASLTGTAALSGKFSGDSVILGGTGSANFADKNVANGKAVTVTGYTISGSDAANYSFTQPTGLNANITPASLSVTGLVANNKVYDATTMASLSGTAGLSGKYAGDAVTLGGTGNAEFADKNVANSKAVTVNGYMISGADASNYILSQPTGLVANITPASLNVTGLSALDKVYDATATASLNGTAALSGKYAGDTVTLGGTGSGTFGDKNVANGKTVTVAGYTISGTDSSNYTLNQPTGLSANITPAALTITGLGASDKVYDSTTLATLTGTALLQGKMSGDTVTLGGSISANFSDKNVGSNKAVGVSGYTISGLDASNYTLTQPTSITAGITAATLSINGIAVNNKVYDATTAATLSGTAALQGLFSGDLVNLSVAGATAGFGDKNVGTGKAVSVSGYTVSGTDAANYNLSQPTGLSANITQASLTVGGVTAANKVYDATNAATLNGTATLSGLMVGDNVTLGGTASASFANKNVGNAKAVTVIGYNISGGDASNYNFIQPGGLNANITPATLGIAGISANDKVYDGNTSATLQVSGTSLTGKYAGDAVTLVTGSVNGTFADRNAGTGKTVLISGFSISGTDASNYTLLPAGSVTANITQKALSLTGAFTASSKTYDGNNTAAIANNTLVLNGIVAGDSVTLNPAAAFADAAVGNNKIVSISPLSTFGGANGANYSLLLTGSPTALASIISAKPAISSDVTQTTTAIFSAQPSFATTTVNAPSAINTLASVSGNNPSEKIINLPPPQISSVPAAAQAQPATDNSKVPGLKPESACDDGGSAGSCN